MKTFATCFLLIGALVAAAYAYPARGESKNPEDDAEYIVVPLEHQRPSYFNRYPSGFDSFDGVVDTDDFPHPVAHSPVYFPSVNPFTWQFSSYLDDLMRRLRERFAGSWNPFYGGSDFAPSGPGIWPIEIPDDSSEDAQTNSTSTVKIIDGHKVIINDTYYTKKSEFGTSVYKVRVIDVKPLDDAEGETEKPSSEEKPSGEEKPVDSGTRVGGDDEDAKKDGESDSDKKEEPATEAPATEAPRRDTELESSDEDTTAADDSVNAIDSSTDIDAPKKVEEN